MFQESRQLRFWAYHVTSNYQGQALHQSHEILYVIIAFSSLLSKSCPPSIQGSLRTVVIIEITYDIIISMTFLLMGEL